MIINLHKLINLHLFSPLINTLHFPFSFGEDARRADEVGEPVPNLFREVGGEAFLS